jgi:hypothetical protein
VDPRTGLDDVELDKFLTVPGLELRFVGRPTALCLVCCRLVTAFESGDVFYEQAVHCDGCCPLSLRPFLS